MKYDQKAVACKSFTLEQLDKLNRGVAIHADDNAEASNTILSHLIPIEAVEGGEGEDGSFVLFYAEAKLKELKNLDEII